MFIFGQIESDRVIGAAAVSVVLLAISFVVLLGDLARCRAGGPGMSARWARLGLRTAALGYLFLLLAAPVGLVFFRTFEHGIGPAWEAVTTPEAQHAFWLTFVMVAVAVPLNTIFGVITALVLVRSASSRARRC